MSRKKGLHIFEPGDMVIPHPIISILWKDIEEGDLGLVLKSHKQLHPQKGERSSTIFWIFAQKEIRYSNNILFHLHHEERVQKIIDAIQLNPWKNNNYGHSLHRHYFNNLPRLNPYNK